MSVLVVGLSHSSAPMPTLERVVVTGDALVKLLEDVRLSEHVAGCFVLSTCNRVEVYAEVDRFHDAVAAVCELLVRHSCVPLTDLTASAYVHYGDRAVQHLLAVACGLESMVVGESQILGQVREAVKLARQHGTLGRELSDVGALALRTGKRAHTETGIDAAGQSLVSLGLDFAVGHLGRSAGHSAAGEDGAGQLGAGHRGAGYHGPMGGLAVLVVGAGSMSSLATATAVRRGAGPIVIANRTRRAAELLAARFGASATGLADLPARIAAADLVIACTGAPGYVISAATVADALRLRTRDRPPPGGTARLALLDLALPRDIEPEAGRLDRVSLIDLATMGASGTADGRGETQAVGPATGSDVLAVRQIVTEELAAYLQADRAARVAPTVVALRAKAATVVESELARLERRLTNLDARSWREIAQAMGRIADKLVHAPTVRVKELAGSPGAEAYETALRVLFELDPEAIGAVARPDDMLSAPADTGEGREAGL